MNSILNAYRKKNILITGGLGYLGSNLMSVLKEQDCQILCLDRIPKGYSNLRGSVKYLDYDIRKQEIWEDIVRNKVDFIFYFAAQTSVKVANEDPVVDYDINVRPVFNMLETCRKMELSPTIIFSGTVTEAGIPEKLPVNESHPDFPITVYDLHKLIAETYLKYYARLGVVKSAVLRLSNAYGPGPKSSSADRGVMNIMIRKALNGEDITLFGKGDFIRDYIYIDDIIAAFITAGSCIEAVNGENFIIGSQSGYTLEEAFNLVADRVAIKTGKRVSVINVESPKKQSPIDLRNFIADTSVFRKRTGWKCLNGLGVGVDKTIEFFLNKILPSGD